MTHKELYAHALGYYHGRTVGFRIENLFDGESESYWFKRGYDSGVADYCEEDEFPTDESRSYGSHLNEKV